MPRKKTPPPEAAQPTPYQCRLPVLPFKGWPDKWANFYVHVPQHVPVMDVDREWLFATKEEAEGFASWLDQMLGLLEYFWVKEKMARDGKKVSDAVEFFVQNKDSIKPHEMECEEDGCLQRRNRPWTSRRAR